MLSTEHIIDKNLEAIKKATAEDLALKKVISYIGNGWPDSIRSVDPVVRQCLQFKDELAYQDGLIMRPKNCDSSSCIVPIWELNTR